MVNMTAYASTLDGLCEQFDAFCALHQLPKLSADELLCELYGEEPRREDLCQWLRGFIESWDAVCHVEQNARLKQDGRPQPTQQGAVAVGQRIRLTRAVDRFPDFLAPAGLTGIVTVADEHGVWAQMDQHIAGAGHWDNEIHWETKEDFAVDTEPCP
jgi:hypothetical protein